MEKRIHKEIDAEVRLLHDSDNEMSDKIDHEETMKEQTEKNLQIEVERIYTEYHNLKASDLPMYRVYEGYKCKWYYKLEVRDGKQLCIKIVDDELYGMELTYVSSADILYEQNKPCKEHEWILATTKVLNYISPNTLKS